MAYNQLGMNRSSGIYNFIADSTADLVKLPKWSALGSSCYIINESALYIKGGANKWVKQSSANNAPSSIPNFETQIVNSLPSVGQDGVVYLVPISDAEDNNRYKEYLYVNGRWEQFGNIDMDLIPIDMESLLEEEE